MRKPTLIDTDIMLDILRGRNEQVRSNALRYLEVYPFPVTANEKHFQRVVELGYPLPIENWRKEQIPFE